MLTKRKGHLDSDISALLRVSPTGLSEWELAMTIFPWSDNSNRSKHGGWITCVVKALWKMERQGRVGHFWVSHGDGVPGTRIWVDRTTR